MSEAAALDTGPSAGTLLRRAREAAGLHVAALAVSLKVPVRKLEALENDRYDQLPDAVFTRALASSVCRTLKVDAQPILDRLPQSAVPRLVPDTEAIGAPFRAPGDAAPPGWQESLKRPVTLAVGGLLLGAIAILLLPNLRGSEVPVAAPAAETPAVPMAEPVVVPAATAGQVTTMVDIPRPAGAAPGAVPSTGAVTVPSQPSTISTTVGTPAAAPASAPVASPNAAAAAAAGIVVFKASGPSWVEVTDRQGNVSLRRLLAAGESAGATGTLPLAVTIGSVNTTAVEVRGKPFDLRPVSRDNVARFEIK
ncbi:helix-turn-helix domain-containing protein [Ramlibacter sp. Leaf400]|uniref:helix-turn-helix domain-containing protein n=1 Tax=Ramlibacter sp. Leaf400 TaxID=1736365 RepID=UPI0006FD336E|nr:helix-turn-helix domain-containing protein [Ramlibacter sp. Leaf400]KQT10632.1 hypothetical protein ASG30_07405 [Ramlibacter sp. Leaf400]